MIYNATNSKSILCYEDSKWIINDYYQHIVCLIKQILENNPNLNLNIILSHNHIFKNTNKTIIININHEHTLVKKGGRGIELNTPVGEVYYDNNEYLVRIYNYDIIKNSDIIIDYSNPNIFNVSTCNLFSELSKKHIYISASIYENYFIKDNRNILSLTTFYDITQPRRNNLLNKIKNENIHHINVHNCFEKTELNNILKRTKILINIHQTDHHDTFEELRVLPALESGVIVISEKSPLNHLIPYNDLIIWETYDNIIDKLKEVINNYDMYHEKIFSTENKCLLNTIKNKNYHVLENEILKRSK